MKQKFNLWPVHPGLKNIEIFELYKIPNLFDEKNFANYSSKSVARRRKFVPIHANEK